MAKGKPSCRYGMLACAAAAMLVAPMPAAADHHLVKRALQEARCIPATFRRTDEQGRPSTYTVECRGRPRRTLTLVCTAARCFVDDHRGHERDDEESP